MLWALLALIGLVVGVFGTIIGVAGGFLLVPVLLFLYPQEPPVIITSISLSVAFLSASSGSLAYARFRRIHYRSGLLFSAAGVPGAIIGASLTAYLGRGMFQALFGAVLLVVSVYIGLRPQRLRPAANPEETFNPSYNLPLGVLIAFGVGFLGGLLGLAGGIVLVPALIQVLGFPPRIATATSLFVVAVTALAAVSVHVVSGAFTEGFRRTAVLAAGAILGAQLGARLSQWVPANFIVRLLAVGLFLVGLRLLLSPG